MTNLVKAGIVVAGALVLGAAGFAQDPYYQPRPRPYYGAQDRYDRGPAYSGGPMLSEVDQVRADLDEVLGRGYLSHGERNTLAHAQKDLSDFQREWSRGRMSFHELDEAIGRVQSVADRGRMSGRERNILQDDANRLRELRAGGRRGGYGYR